MLDRSFNLGVLRALPIFAPLSDESLEYLRPVLSISTRRAGEVILEEGTPGSELHVLLEGEVRVLQGHLKADERTLATLRPVEVLGEMALLTGDLRSATVVAAEPCVLLTLTKEGLEEVLLTHPSICIALLQDAYRRIAAIHDRR